MGLTTLGDYSFRNCSSLKGITIPSSVVCIGKYAFYNCNSLGTVAFKNPSGWQADTTFLNEGDLSNSYKGATYLTKTYCQNVWKRYDKKTSTGKSTLLKGFSKFLGI